MCVAAAAHRKKARWWEEKRNEAAEAATAAAAISARPDELAIGLLFFRSVLFVSVFYWCVIGRVIRGQIKSECVSGKDDHGAVRNQEQAQDGQRGPVLRGLPRLRPRVREFLARRPAREGQLLGWEKVDVARPRAEPT